MKDLENLLENRKKNIQRLEAPVDLEERLNKALVAKKSKRNNKGVIAIALVLFLMFSYNFDAIAFYGKKIIGYDEVAYGAIKDLNELGKGQVVNKSYNFANGVEVILDGVMVDDNQLVAFYRIIKEDGGVGEVNLHSIQMNRQINNSGVGQINDSDTEISWISSFDPPGFFTRNLKFQFTLSGKKGLGATQGEITFKLDRSKAMGSSIKQKINKSVELGGNKVHFNSITASPTVTVIEGTIDNRLDLLKNSRSNSHPNFQIDFELYANGEKVEQRGAGLRSSLKGYTFEGRFEALPNEIRELEIKVVGLTSSRNVDQTFDLSGQEDLALKVLDREVVIKEVVNDSNATYLTITTQQDVLLERVYLLTGKDRLPLEKTIVVPEGYTKNDDGTINYTRTLQFMGTGEKLKLEIGRIRSLEGLGETIQIPLN